MAFTKITNAELNKKGATKLANQPKIGAQELKAVFEEPAKNVVAPAVNRLIDELEAETGAASLGAVGGTVQDALSNISTVIINITSEVSSALVSVAEMQSEVSAMAVRVEAVEETAHTHENKSLLDTYEQTEADLSDAVTKKHDHENKTVLDKFGESGGNPTYNGNPIGGGSGEGDMKASDYDSDDTVKNAGGIAAYVSTAAISIKEYADSQISTQMINVVPSIVSSQISSQIINASEVKLNGAFTVGSRDAGYSTGTKSVAEGYYVTASGNYSHAEGDETLASGDFSHAEGGGTTASGINSHAEGYETLASESYAHAEGNDTTASGNGAHAEGFGTTARGKGAHAEGNESIASGSFAHAEGNNAIASQTGAHVEGSHTSASGNYSHAEGSATTASAFCAHAEGNSTTASGSHSHASGEDTVAGYDNQTVVGQYNNNKSDTLFEVGNGTDDSTRSNAFEVYANGDINYTGTLKKNGNDILATKADISAVPVVVVETTGTASASDVAYERIGIDGVYTEIDGTKYMESTTKTTASGVDTFTFTNAAITADGVFDYYSDVYGAVPMAVTPSAGQLLVKFNSADGVTKCRVYIKG